MVYILKMFVLLLVFLLEFFMMAVLMVLSFIIWKDLLSVQFNVHNEHLEKYGRKTTYDFPLTYHCYLRVLDKI